MTITTNEFVGDKAIMRRTFVDKDVYLAAVKSGTYGFEDPEAKDSNVKLVSDEWIEEAGKYLSGYFVRGHVGNSQKGYYIFESVVGHEVTKAKVQHQGPSLIKGAAEEKWNAFKSKATEVRSGAEKVMGTATPAALSVDDLLRMAGGQAGQTAGTVGCLAEQPQAGEAEESGSEGTLSGCDAAEFDVFDIDRRVAAKARAKATAKAVPKAAPKPAASPQPKAAKLAAPASGVAGNGAYAGGALLSGAASAFTLAASSDGGSRVAGSAADTDEFLEGGNTKRAENLEIDMDGRVKRLQEGIEKDMVEIEKLEGAAYDLSFVDEDLNVAMGKGNKFGEQLRAKMKNTSEIMSKVKIIKGKYDRSQSSKKEELLKGIMESVASTSEVAEKTQEMIKNILAPSCAHSDVRDSILAVMEYLDPEDPQSPFRVSSTFFLLLLESDVSLKVQFGNHKEVATMLSSDSDEVKMMLRYGVEMEAIKRSSLRVAEGLLVRLIHRIKLGEAVPHLRFASGILFQMSDARC